ncbi:hypothetical protein QWM81_23980 [Streptomyces ficellus]|uniref:Hydrogenase expression protein HypF n=1 Tax=Streptomyces ficellus TaxID=1977088 RepID=A0ABT7ZC19_9ACTN|nr:hypothetical protein [Streptomyces ficellus]MDN3297048.1 hypothetical protein [Streptomyces ficellus]
MRGDETQPATRKGPRHAAPRKSLLTKLQAPAGKAIALAAMPTAVLVGLGMTPKPALADDKDIPFAPGPCVTRSDEPQESEKPSASASPSPSPSPSQSASDPADQNEPTPGASPSASETDQETTGPKTGVTPPVATTAPTPSATPTPTPTPTEPRNPLDPLGVGDAIKDFFDGPAKEPAATPPATAPTPAAPSPDQSSAEPPTKPATRPATKPSAEPSAKPAQDEALDRTKEAIKDAADKAGATVEELPEDVKGLDPQKDPDVPDGAKPRFPCPTPDPQALADAKAEPGIPLLPDDPWRLQSTMLTLRGLDYHGIVEVKTGSGKIKKALKFTASEVDIKDLHQLTVHSKGVTGHVTSRPGSTSTIRGGTVTMYTEELKGNLFGIIPITFSPETPPPLNVPFAFFTDVKVTQAGQFGGTLTVPGLKNFIEG